MSNQAGDGERQTEMTICKWCNRNIEKDQAGLYFTSDGGSFHCFKNPDQLEGVHVPEPVAEVVTPKEPIDDRTGHYENCVVNDGYPLEACDCGIHVEVVTKGEAPVKPEEWPYADEAETTDSSAAPTEPPSTEPFHFANLHTDTTEEAEEIYQREIGRIPSFPLGARTEGYLSRRAQMQKRLNPVPAAPKPDPPQEFEEWYQSLTNMQKCPAQTTSAVKAAYLLAWNAARQAPSPHPLDEPMDYWRCFHCDFYTKSREKAEAHFGDRDDAEEFKPICKWWAHMDDTERKHAFQDVIQQLNDERSAPVEAPSVNEIKSAADGDHIEVSEAERENFLIHQGKLYILESVAAKAVMRGEERLMQAEAPSGEREMRDALEMYRKSHKGCVEFLWKHSSPITFDIPEGTPCDHRCDICKLVDSLSKSPGAAR